MQNKIKSNTATICGALDTFHLPDREDGVCAYCGEYNSELALDGCCPEDNHAMPNDLTCRKARRLRALSNGDALRRGEIGLDKIDPLEGVAKVTADGIEWVTL